MAVFNFHSFFSYIFEWCRKLSSQPLYVGTDLLYAVCIAAGKNKSTHFSNENLHRGILVVEGILFCVYSRRITSHFVCVCSAKLTTLRAGCQQQHFHSPFFYCSAHRVYYATRECLPYKIKLYITQNNVSKWKQYSANDATCHPRRYKDDNFFVCLFSLVFFFCYAFRSEKRQIRYRKCVCVSTHSMSLYKRHVIGLRVLVKVKKKNEKSIFFSLILLVLLVVCAAHIWNKGFIYVCFFFNKWGDVN